MDKFDDIAVGDEVAVPRGFGNKLFVKRVEKVTTTRFIAGDQAWLKSDGRLVGSSGWEMRWAQRATPEIKAKAEHRAIADLLGAVNWHEMTLEQLRSMYQAYKAATPADPIARDEAQK